MARIRYVKPEFWSDATIGECSPSARLLFIATWNFADDHGSLDRSAKQLKAQAFPYDAFDCEPLIQELLKFGLLIEYEAGGKKYLHIKNFQKHQRIDRPSNPRVPLFEGSQSTTGGLDEDSTSPRPSSLILSSLSVDTCKPARGVDVSQIPGLDLDAWQTWVAYRAQRKPAIKPASMLTAAKALAAFGLQQRAAVDHSVANGYQGLFPPKQNGSHGPALPTKPAPSASDRSKIEAEQRAAQAARDRYLTSPPPVAVKR